MLFKIGKTSQTSRARVGVFETPHGVVETPTLVPVATAASVKTLESEEVLETKTQILITNTFHLSLRPGEKIIKRAGGLHKFMNWPRPLMSDSGGFQVFSLGFGRDLGVGKILKYFPGRMRNRVEGGDQPQRVKITSEGIHFLSPFDGRHVFLGPKESIKIQEALGADIIFAFDECTPPLASLEYARQALARTHAWAKICLDAHRSKQLLFGIVQGSRYKSLREEAARFIGQSEFDGFGIGGDLGDDREYMLKILDWIIPHLPVQKPRHLLGIGRLSDIEPIIKKGIDTFDCIVPTHYARHGSAFISSGKIDLSQTKFLKDKKPLDPKCDCRICGTYTRGYISHLFRAGELSALKMLTFHNLFFFNRHIAKIRQKIKDGKI